MLTRIQNASLFDVKRELSRMLGEGSQSSNVRRLTETAIAGKQDKVAAVFDFVQKTFPYVPDPYNIELFIHPNRVAEDYFQGRVRQMDCDDYSLLTGAMLASCGYRTRLALLDADFDYLIDHAISQFYSEKLQSWVNADASTNRPLGWIIESRYKIYVEPTAS